MRPNILLMFAAVAVIAVVGMVMLATSVPGADPATIVVGIVGIVGSVAALAGPTIKELVAPTKSEAQIAFEGIGDVLDKARSLIAGAPASDDA